MSKLTVALCTSAFVFGSVLAQADDSDKNPPEEKATAKSQTAPKKDWPTRREKQEATAAAARERAERVAPKEQPLVSDVGPPGVNAPDRSKVKPKPLTTVKAKKPTSNDEASSPEQTPAPTGKQ
jgi:hypothetical protein